MIDRKYMTIDSLVLSRRNKRSVNITLVVGHTNIVEIKSPKISNKLATRIRKFEPQTSISKYIVYTHYN